MTQCRYKDCTSEADSTLEIAGNNGLITEVAKLCAPCKKKFLEGWDRMNSDAGTLKDKGVSQEELNRIMLARVERGEYLP